MWVELVGVASGKEMGVGPVDKGEGVWCVSVESSRGVDGSQNEWF